MQFRQRRSGWSWSALGTQCRRGRKRDDRGCQVASEHLGATGTSSTVLATGRPRWRAAVWSIVQCVVLLTGFAMGLAPFRAAAAQQEVSLKQRVAELVRRLDAPRAAVRDEAEEALLKLGPDALPWLPSLGDPALSAEQRLRLERVVRRLREAVARRKLAGTHLSLHGTYRLGTLLELLEEQSGNRIIDRRRELGQPVEDPQITVDWEHTSFWAALLEVCRKGKLTVEFFDSEQAVAVLSGPMPRAPRVIEGGLLVMAESLTLRTDYVAARSVGHLQLLVAWEPAIRVVRLRLDLSQTRIVDDQGGSLLARVPDERLDAIQATPASGQIAVPLTVPLLPPAVGAREIAELDATLHVLVSGAVRPIRVGPLAPSLRGERRTADMKLRVLQVREELGVWRIQVKVDYLGADQEQEAVTESYEDWFLQTAVYLVHRASGKRFELNGGYNLLATGQRSYAVEYLFVDAPGKMSDYDLVIEVPAEPTWTPVKLRFEGLPLPVRGN